MSVIHSGCNVCLCKSCAEKDKCYKYNCDDCYGEHVSQCIKNKDGTINTFTSERYS